MQGLTKPEIAERLFISTETVKPHRGHILTKTGARNPAALVTYYHQTFFDNQDFPY
jgi:DNA-binding NarL/FixJ family response regulator